MKTVLSSVNVRKVSATNLQFSPWLQGPHSILKGQAESNLEKKISKMKFIIMYSHVPTFYCSYTKNVAYPVILNTFCT